MVFLDCSDESFITFKKVYTIKDISTEDHGTQTYMYSITILSNFTKGKTTKKLCLPKDEIDFCEFQLEFFGSETSFVQLSTKGID